MWRPASGKSSQIDNVTIIQLFHWVTCGWTGTRPLLERHRFLTLTSRLNLDSEEESEVF